MEDRKEKVIQKDSDSSIWGINKILMNLIRFIILTSVLIFLVIVMKYGYEAIDKAYDKAHVFSMDFYLSEEELNLKTKEAALKIEEEVFDREIEIIKSSCHMIANKYDFLYKYRDAEPTLSHMSYEYKEMEKIYTSGTDYTLKTYYQDLRKKHIPVVEQYCMTELAEMVKSFNESNYHSRIEITETDHINIINKDYVEYSTHLKNYNGYEVSSVQNFEAGEELAQKYNVIVKFKNDQSSSKVVFRNSESANKFLNELQSRYNTIMNKEVVIEIVE